MNVKKATNSQLSTTEFKTKQQLKQTTRTGNRIIDMEIIWSVVNWEGKRGEWENGAGIKKCNW